MHACNSGRRKYASSAVTQAFLSLESTFATAVNLLWLWLALLHTLRFAIVLLHRINVVIVLLHRITVAIDNTVLCCGDRSSPSDTPSIRPGSATRTCSTGTAETIAHVPSSTAGHRTTNIKALIGCLVWRLN